MPSARGGDLFNKKTSTTSLQDPARGGSEDGMTTMYRDFAARTPTSGRCSKAGGWNEPSLSIRSPCRSSRGAQITETHLKKPQTEIK